MLSKIQRSLNFILRMRRIGASEGTNRAFLLFEAMIAVVVLAVGITLVLRSFNSAVMAVKGLQDYTTAMFLAQEKMSQLETQGIEETGREGKFNREFAWKIDSVPLEEAALDKLETSVIWNTANSTRTFSVQTYIEHK